MKIAYATNFEARTLTDVNNWAGSYFYIGKSLQNSCLDDFHYLGPLKESLITRIFCKFKRHYHENIFRKGYFRYLDPVMLQGYSNQISSFLSKKDDVDIIFSATINSIAYLKCKQPIVFWADATFKSLLDNYPQYQNLCKETIHHGHLMEKLALERCRLAIYASNWAAQTAIEHYGADPAKVKVVPFGANIDTSRTLSETKELIEARSSNQCKLLFLGVDWYRKGGDVALKVAKELNGLGLDTELTVVGCHPVVEGDLPSFVKPLGFISKSTTAGKDKINRLIGESHFLILPSRAECYGVVFCEANSFGVPCLSTNVGGIPTIIKSNVNGNLFNLNASISEYCDYICSLFTNYTDYKSLALSAFNEYQSRLNWDVAGKTVRNLLVDIIS